MSAREFSRSLALAHISSIPQGNLTQIEATSSGVSTQYSAVLHRPQQDNHTYPAITPEVIMDNDPLNKATRNTRQSRTVVDLVEQLKIRTYNFVRTSYIIAITPPFSHNVPPNWKEQLLERHLDGLKTWGWGANAALSTAVAALLALTSVTDHAFPQTFLILSGIFSFFGFIYASLLAFHVGTWTTGFKAKFCDRANSKLQRRHLWNGSVMISLPVTWMCWSIVNFLGFLVALGVEMFILDLRSMGNEQSPIQNFGDPIPQSSTDRSMHAAMTLNISQLTMFMLTVVWSLIHMRMIHTETRVIEGELEAGLLDNQYH
ncbi:hypothetical protein MVEN_01748800 [Mycena venus]|uniref:Uncharacterized protein n=1 Tax=Mycena venus TaxID=2733690 RepID=A0A8H6XMK9_9AGAR|nr:hypothetical protein MVEN_01748800 [Mycena venus]